MDSHFNFQFHRRGNLKGNLQWPKNLHSAAAYGKTIRATFLAIPISRPRNATRLLVLLGSTPRRLALRRDQYDRIAASMAGSATKNKVRAFAEVCVKEVILVWQVLRENKSPAEADNYLANKGSRKKR